MGMSWEMTPESVGRLRKLIVGLRTDFLNALGISSHAASMALAEKLLANMQREFIAGGHDKSASTESNPLGRTPTVKDVEMHPTAFGASCSMGGAASLIQFGSAPHIINARNGPFLVFEGREGNLVRTSQVSHPGYAGDDFLGRAVEELDLSDFAVRVVGDAYARLIPH